MNVYVVTYVDASELSGFDDVGVKVFKDKPNVETLMAILNIGEETAFELLTQSSANEDNREFFMRQSVLN